jgi:hypothetical protein
MAVHTVEGLVEVVGQSVGGGDGVPVGLDLDGAAGGADELPDRPTGPVFGRAVAGQGWRTAVTKARNLGGPD